MKSMFRFAAMGVALLFVCAAPASAGKRNFSIDPYGARTQGSATRELETGGLSGIMLPEGGGGGEFGIGFVIPKPYKKNSPIRIIFNWQTEGTNCDVRLEPEFLDRSRPGHASTVGFFATDGLAPENALAIMTAPAVAGEGSIKVFTLIPGQGFDQLSGDAITMAFIREDGDPSDTCTDDVFISGITVEYSTP